MEPAPTERALRLLFASYHCHLDPSSGAALSVCDLLKLLAGRGWSCRAFSGPHLDFPQPRPLAQLLADPCFRFGDGGPIRRRNGKAGTTPFSLFELVQDGIPVTLFDTPGTVPFRAPTQAEGEAFLVLLQRTLEEFRPDLLLTYGGHWLAQALLAVARQRGIPTVFWLRNCAYHDARLFQPVQGILVPSRFTADHYRRTLGLKCTAIPSPLNWDRVRCGAVQGRFVTFINPEPNKGVFPFARIATELARRRRDIPLLVVEGRGKVNSLQIIGLDFDALGNLNLMANTPDPRAFFRVSRMVLMPSLWQETFGRVTAEALINGIPVLASNRGGLPEVLEQAGFLFDIPARYTPESRQVPTAEEMAPWVETIIRLWDDDAFHATESQRCRAAAESLRPELLGWRYDTFLRGLLGLLPTPEPILTPLPPDEPATPTTLPAAAPEAPAVSVVLPVGHEVAGVERAVRSVLAQTFADWELLVVVAGATDDRYEQVCRLAATDPRIRPFHFPDHHGLAAARHQGRCLARGATLAYLEAGDEFYPDYLAQVHAWRSRADVVVCGHDLVGEGSETVACNPVPHRALLLQQPLTTLLGMAHSRELLARVGLHSEANPFDDERRLWHAFQQAAAVFLFSDLKSGRHPVRPNAHAGSAAAPSAT